eukprot:gb/GEZN01005994.1/.p1 GENE.gb/GEZN01005994.1/~~gb/GEZN01005994.1/.p1  ORF type:complete len:526 (+),score=117.77 gb/GEZN01005994.1/:23-1600(+)
MFGRLRKSISSKGKSPGKGTDSEDDAGSGLDESTRSTAPFDYLTHLITYEPAVHEGKLSWYDRPNKKWNSRWFTLYPGALLWWSGESAHKGEVEGLLPLDAVQEASPHGDPKNVRFNLALALAETSVPIPEEDAPLPPDDDPPPPPPGEDEPPPPPGSPGSAADKERQLNLRAKNSETQAQWIKQINRCSNHTKSTKMWNLSTTFYLNLPVVLAEDFASTKEGYSNAITQELLEEQKKRQAEMEKEDESYVENEEKAQKSKAVTEDPQAVKLRSAAEKKNIKTVKSILAKKASPDALDLRTGNTAMMEACRVGAKDVVDALLESKAQVNLQDEHGFSALFYAEMYSHKAIMTNLLEGKADPNLRDNDGEVMLMKASTNDRHENVDMLIKYGAKVNLQECSGETALGMACKQGHIELAQSLVEKKAKVNLKDATGCTPIMYAAVADKLEVATLLMAFGADLRVQGKGDIAAKAIKWTLMPKNQEPLTRAHVGSLCKRKGGFTRALTMLVIQYAFEKTESSVGWEFM